MFYAVYTAEGICSYELFFCRLISPYPAHLCIRLQVVVPPALEVVSSAMSNPDKHKRKAALVILYMLVEGCSETLRPMLPQILPVLYKGLDDPEMLVREHACLALAEFSRMWLGAAPCAEKAIGRWLVTCPIVLSALFLFVDRNLYVANKMSCGQIEWDRIKVTS